MLFFLFYRAEAGSGHDFLEGSESFLMGKVRRTCVEESLRILEELFLGIRRKC
jgi:hypothetical protein